MNISRTGVWIGDDYNQAFDEPLAHELSKLFNGKTVSDLGCSKKMYTNYLCANGCFAVGYDGNPALDVIRVDLSQKTMIPKTEWALCLEVGEHIPREFESTFVGNVKRSFTEGVVISWAIEDQPGVGHVNCRNNDYVRSLFSEFENDQATEKKLRDASSLPWFNNTIMVFKR